MEKIVKKGNIVLWTQNFGDPVLQPEPILFISGAGAPATFWPTNFCESLPTKGFFAIRYDNRDMGYSTHFPPTSDIKKPVYTIFDLVEDAMAILDDYGIRQAHIVGHSMGGMITLLMALYHSDRMLSGTVISTGFSVLEVKPKGFWQNFMCHRTKKILFSNKPNGNFEDDLKGWMKSWKRLHGSYRMDEKLAVKYTKEFYIRNPRDASIAYNHIAAGLTVPSNLIAAVQDIRVPILIMHGSKDKLVLVENAYNLASLIPNAELHIIPKAGHMFFHDAIWQGIEEHIVDFICISQKLM